ncbi:MAG: alpha/beta fold hydrolase [Myxococcota bacterium]
MTGRGPALLLTHGFSGSSADWGKLVGPLSERYTVITWDLRGHGRSDSPADPAAYSVEVSLADMAALLDRARAARAVIVGHSLGGYLSLAFHLAHRERVAALVLLDTGPGYRKDDARAGWNRMVEERARAFEAKGPKSLGLALAARGILAQRDGSAIESLPTIAVPTLVVVGENDKTFLAGSRYMAEKVPGAKLEVIAGAGHSPQETHPEDVLRVLRAHLR